MHSFDIFLRAYKTSVCKQNIINYFACIKYTVKLTCLLKLHKKDI